MNLKNESSTKTKLNLVQILRFWFVCDYYKTWSLYRHVTCTSWQKVLPVQTFTTPAALSEIQYWRHLSFGCVLTVQQLLM
jgi:hypothetical protein